MVSVVLSDEISRVGGFQGPILVNIRIAETLKKLFIIRTALTLKKLYISKMIASRYQSEIETILSKSKSIA